MAPSWSGGFLYNPTTKAVFLHRRDGLTKFNPNCWAFFGGQSEPGESPVRCFLRQLELQAGFKAEPDQVKTLCEYINLKFNSYRYVFYVVSDVSPDQLKLGEGADFGWVPLASLQTYTLTDNTVSDLDYFVRCIDHSNKQASNS